MLDKKKDKDVRFIAKISKQGNKRMIIIPSEYHIVTNDLMGNSLWVTLDPIEPGEKKDEDEKEDN